MLPLHLCRIRCAKICYRSKCASYSTQFIPIETIGIVGAGQMGNGIAQVSAHVSKKNVIIFDKNKVAMERAMISIDSIFSRNVEKGKMTDVERKEALSRLIFSNDMKALSKADFVIEAVAEDFGIKQKVFESLSACCRPEVILASNTSSISITKLAAASDRPDRFIGMHFMNPVPVMKLVEIIPGLQTSQETLDQTLNLAEEMQKITAQSKDMPGFIANRLLIPYINEAIIALSENVGSIDDIDKTMKLGTNMPMGPLALADFIGLDTCLAIMRILHSEFGDSKYRPAPILVKYVEANWLGKKNGRGFYIYDQRV